jgi:hypothetical protein
MAAKKKPQGLGGDIGRGINMAGKVVYEVSGAGDAVRFAKNPSLKNAASLGLTVAAYAGGPALKAAAAGRAARAGLAAEKVVLKTQAASLARAIPEKSMKFSTMAHRGDKIPVGKLITKSGTSLPVSGFAKATTPKNINRVTSGRIAAVNAKADKAGKAVVKDTMKAAAPKIKAANTAGVALAGSKAGTTYSTQKNKNKKK